MGIKSVNEKHYKHIKKTASFINPRKAKNDEELWPVFLKLVDENKDQFNFGAIELMRRSGKPNSITMITRERGGMSNWFNGRKTDFLLALHKLVEEEHAHSGSISPYFCRELGNTIVSYYELFAYDVITGSHRNTEMLVEALSPLIIEKYLLFFGAEIYMIIKDWYLNDHFTRDSVVSRYKDRLHDVLVKYQKIRPD